MSRINILRDALHEKEKCEACEKLRRGLTWIGDPPKCRIHRKKIKFEKYYE